jgi:hypothetical protein
VLARVSLRLTPALLAGHEPKASVSASIQVAENRMRILSHSPSSWLLGLVSGFDFDSELRSRDSCGWSSIGVLLSSWCSSSLVTVAAIANDQGSAGDCEEFLDDDVGEAMPQAMPKRLDTCAACAATHARQLLRACRWPSGREVGRRSLCTRPPL